MEHLTNKKDKSVPKPLLRFTSVATAALFTLGGVGLTAQTAGASELPSSGTPPVEVSVADANAIPDEKREEPIVEGLANSDVAGKTEGQLMTAQSGAQVIPRFEFVKIQSHGQERSAGVVEYRWTPAQLFVNPQTVELQRKQGNGWVTQVSTPMSGFSSSFQFAYPGMGEHSYRLVLKARNGNVLMMSTVRKVYSYRNIPLHTLRGWDTARVNPTGFFFGLARNHAGQGGQLVVNGGCKSVTLSFAYGKVNAKSPDRSRVTVDSVNGLARTRTLPVGYTPPVTFPLNVRWGVNLEHPGTFANGHATCWKVPAASVK